MYSFDWETPAFGGALQVVTFRRGTVVFDTLHVIARGHGKPDAPGAGRPRLEDMGNVRAQWRSL
jgi:hypothetical protein